MSLPHATLVLGGARSGKSRYAEALVLEAAAAAIYVATATASDAEMAERIARHRADRGAQWTTVEEPRRMVALLPTLARPDRPVLVDCLTLWLANLMESKADIAAETMALAASVEGLPGPIVFVANEVGLGIVPDNPLAREFRDHAGRLNQAMAAVCGRVVFVAAGLPLVLKT